MRKLMRRLKWVVVGLLAVAVALFVAAYAIITNYPVDDLKALIQDEVKKATGREVAIDGELKMEVLPSPAIVMNGVRLKNAAWGTAPEMLTIGHVEAEVAFWPLINGDIEVRRLVLSDAAVALERNAKGEANWHLGEGDSAGGSGTLPHFADVRLEKTRITFEDHRRGLEGTLTVEALNATSPDAAGPMNVALKGSVDGQPLDLKLVLPAVGALLTAGAKQVEIEGQVGETTLKLQGKVGPLESGANDFRLWLEGKDLAALTPGLPPGPFALEALVQQKSAKTVALSGLKGSVAGATFDGHLALTEAAVPQVEGELHLGKLRLPQAASGGAGKGALFPAEALPFQLLHLADAKLTLTVQELGLGTGRSLSDLATRLSLEGGKLALDPLGFSYDGGTFTGTLHVDAAVSPPATKLRLKGTGLPLGVATDGLLQGGVDVDFDLAARGESPKAMAASLDGHSAVSSAGGTIDSGLASLAEAPLATILRPLTGSSSQTRFNCLVNRMDWKEGIGSNAGTALDADGFTVVGNGTVDLRSETIDFYADVWSKDAAVVGLTVPMIVRGPLANPSAHPDPGGTALGIAKTAGLIVFPPAGLAAIIERSKAEKGNACTAAVDKVEEGGGPAGFFDAAGKAVGDTVDTIGEGAGDAIDTIGEGAEDAIEGLKGLFSN
jgi:uncharacterized protein involved in outer membrane biogenesis